jgi:hypothetical protein
MQGTTFTQHHTSFRTSFSNRTTSRQLDQRYLGREVFYTDVRKIAKSDYWLRHVCPSFRPPARSHGTNRLPLDRFSWNLIWVFFENLASITGTSRKHLCTRMTSRPILLRMRNVSDKSCRENPNALVMSNSVLWKTVPFIWYGKILYIRTSHSWQYGA